MNNLNKLFLLFLIIIFFTGMYIYVFPDATKSMKENIENQEPSLDDCGDILINRGNIILLYNSKKPLSEGSNPLPFYNLDEYINYLDIQKKKGLNCPILYLQRENDAQGQDVYRVRPSPFDAQGGLLPSPIVINPNQTPMIVGTPDNSAIPHFSLLPTSPNVNVQQPMPVLDATRDNPPYNAGNYAGFDPMGFHVGTYTELDAIHDSTERNNPISDNPMDTNWGGVSYTQQQVQSGKYAENTVTRPNYVTPKGTIYPDLHPNVGYPKT